MPVMYVVAAVLAPATSPTDWPYVPALLFVNVRLVTRRFGATVVPTASTRIAPEPALVPKRSCRALGNVVVPFRGTGTIFSRAVSPLAGRNRSVTDRSSSLPL